MTNPPFSLFREYVEQLVAMTEEIPHHRKSERDYLQGDLRADQGNKMSAGLHASRGLYRAGPLRNARGEELARRERHELAELGNACWFTNLDIAKAARGIGL